METQPTLNSDTSASLDFSTFYNVIKGKLVSTEVTRHGINPATEKLNPEVPLSTPADVEAAVQAAQGSFPGWASTSIHERREALNALADAMKQEQNAFADMLRTEQGMPPAVAQIDVSAGVQWLRGIAHLELPETTIREDEKTQVVVRYVPLGPAVGIVPWNFPVFLACGKIAQAVLTGNPIIIKPSPFTPYCSLKIVELAQRFFPPGVVQALSGDDDLGPWLTSHPGIRKISFTGWTETGKKVMESASKTLKQVTLELGGNDAAIVCHDVEDIEVAARMLSWISFVNSGQVCCGTKRIYVHKSIYQKFLGRMVANSKTFKTSADKDAFMGPISNKMQYDRINAMLDEIEHQGLNIALRGRNSMSEPGYFIPPTIVDNPSDDSNLVREGCFGPIVPVLSWSTEEEVVRRVNNNDMGLGASIWSKDTSTANRLAHQMQAGTVWINAHGETDPAVPFAGSKQSGIGCEWGVEGLQGFCNMQTLYLKKE